MSFRIPFVAAALLSAALPAAADDLTIVSKVTRDGAEPSTATSELESTASRMPTRKTAIIASAIKR